MKPPVAVSPVQMPAGMTRHLLLVRSGTHLCGFPLETVDETLRPMPYEALPGLPRWLRGLSVVRGKPTPIVDLRALLGEHDGPSPSRLVTVRSDGERRVGLLVDEVLGLQDVTTLPSDDLPSLLGEVAGEIVESLARLDERLLMVLRMASVVPDALWQRLETLESP